MARQQTMSSQDGHSSGKTFSLLVILTGHIFTAVRFKRSSIPFTRLGYSSYYHVFLTLWPARWRDVTEIKISRAGKHDCQQSQQFYFELWDSISWVKWHSENSLLKNMHSVHLHFQFLYPSIGRQTWKSQTKITLDLLGETGHRWQSFCAEI